MASLGVLSKRYPQAAARLLERLRETRHADLAAGFTTAGPHRADLLVQIRGLSARSYGSQGQQRSAVLALKLAEASVLREVTGEQPVALLDDVMSELDLSRLAGVHHLLRSGRGAAAGRRPGLPDAGRNPDAGRVVPF